MTYSTAAHAERLTRPASVSSVWLGDTRVSYVPDGVARLRPRILFPDTTSRTWAERPEFLDGSGNLVVSVGALLVENGGRALLIDAGFGPQSSHHPDGPLAEIDGGALPDSLTALGRSPEDIEAVAITHLHSDHIGWAWYRAAGSRALPRADYVMSEPEWAQHDLLEAQGMGEEMAGIAPHVRTVADGQEIFPGVRIRVGAGHTPGHAEYVIETGGRRLVAFGDAMHSPIQVEHPEWSVAFDHESGQAAVRRRTLIAELADPDTLGFGVHFADVVFGRVQQEAEGAVWRPLDA